MNLTQSEWLRTGRWMGLCLTVMALMGMALPGVACAQAVSTTTVQGTVYLANGQAGAGTLDVSWPAFTTANGQAIAAGRISATIGQDGFVSVNLAPNMGATPAGLYYTAVYQMSNGATSTEYWVVPAAAQASLGQVRAQVMPSSQAVQAVSKAYVDQAITELTESLLTASGGTLSGPLYLNGDPTQPLQAADKHYVDSTFNMEVPIAGGSMTGPLATPAVNGVQSPVAGSPQTTLQAAVSAAGTSGAVEIPPAYAGTDSFTNPNGVYVTDLRPRGAQQFERSVKEFGAVCDGTTDDTSALQTALNYAQTHGVALTIPQGTCKTRTLSWHGESIGGLGKQVSALMGFPGQDVLATAADSTNLLSYTHLHDLTIYVDQSVDVSCSAAQGRAPAGSCAVSRLLEKNSIFAPGGNGLTGTVGTGTAWAVGNCALAMPATTGAGGNGLRVAEIENLEIAATGADPLAAQYPGAHSTHTCAMYLAQWPQWSEFRNIDIRGLNTGIAIPALPVAAPAGLNADSNRWQNITIQATHAFTAAAGSNNVLDNVVAMATNSAATAEPPTGLVLDLSGAQQGWTVRNAVVLPSWIMVPPSLTVAASGGAVTGVTVGSEHGLGFDPYGTQVPLTFSGSCTAQAAANVKSDGSIGTISVTQGGVGCSGTTTASVSAAGTWDTAAPVNLIAGQSMAFLGGNLLKGNGGYTVWNAASSQSAGTQLGGGGGTLPGGGTYGGLVANSSLGTSDQVDQFPGADFGVKLQACLGAVSPSYGGTCDARNFTGSLSMASNLTISAANATVLLPCATISTASKVIVTAGARNVALRGCALRGASTASGSQGGTVFLYSGTGAMVQVGDPTYAADTQGFHMDNVAINTTASSSATAQGLMAYRTQELDLESLYFLGNSNQTGMTLDGTGNYTGGTFFDNAFSGFQTAVNAIGHQATNPATTDWLNASTFVRLHIDCPTSAGNPLAGTYGINLQQGDGNTFTGGDVEGCSTALHLGTNAQNNTIVGLRNENSTNQVVADAGSFYNNWMSGGTMFTGQLTDNGTRNSFLDTFHRSFNGLNGDWYGSQKDATLTNHYRIGIGAGNERGLLNEIQTDYGYRWIEGYSDATAGEQFYQVQDLLNNVPRLSIGQYNSGQSSTNNQTVLNAAGTGAIVLNGSNNSGTGGVVIGSGGASESTVATISNAGNAQFNGTLQVGGASTFAGSTTVKNQTDAEIDQFLWAGATSSQKESFIYKDWNGNSQWYMVKDASNNWALNSATGGLDSFKAYQSTNSGDTYINASNSSGVVRVNYETGSGAGFNIYGGNSGALYASFTGTAAIRLPGLAAGSGHNCLQIDNSGYITNTGTACGTGSGSGSGSGTVSSANAGQIAYYTGNGTSIGGMSAVPVTSGGTGALTSAAALANLGAQAYIPGLSGDGQATPGIVVPGDVAAGTIGALVQASQSSGSSWGEKILNCLATAKAASTNICDARGLVGSQTLDANLIFTPSNASGMTILLPSNLTVAQGSYQVEIQNNGASGEVQNFSILGDVFSSNVAGTAAGAVFTYTGSSFAWEVLDGPTAGDFIQGLNFRGFAIRGNGASANGLYLGSPTMDVTLDNVTIELPTSGNSGNTLELNSPATTGFYSQQLNLHNDAIAGGAGVLVTGSGLENWSQVTVDGRTHINASGNTGTSACVTITAGEFTMHGTDLEECYYGVHTYTGGAVNWVRPDGCCTTYGVYFDGPGSLGNLVFSSNLNNLQGNGAYDNTVLGTGANDVDGLSITGTGGGVGTVARLYVQDAPMSMELGSGKTTPEYVSLIWGDTSSGAFVNKWEARKTNGSQYWQLVDDVNSATRISVAPNGEFDINAAGTSAIVHDYNNAISGSYEEAWYGGTTSKVASLTPAGAMSALSYAGAGTGLTGTAANLSIGGSAGSATNATNVANTGAVSTNANFYIPFLSGNTSANYGLNTSSGISFNPSTSVLSASHVYVGSTGSLTSGASFGMSGAGYAQQFAVSTNYVFGLCGYNCFSEYLISPTTGQLRLQAGGSTALTYGVTASTTWDFQANPVTSTGAATFGKISVAAARKGTFICTAAGTITITNANELITSDVIISLNTAGGTISTPPAMKTVATGTGFTVLCGAADTSTYNYDILN